MDISSISGTAQMLSSGQTKQTMSVSMIKQAADQQNQIASMLSQVSQSSPLPTSNSGTGYSFSTYA